MTEPTPSGDAFSASFVERPKRKLPRPARIAVAAFLSLLLPGMGQLYACKPWRGMAFALASTTLDALTIRFRLFLTFPGGIATLAAGLLWHLYAIADAGYLAWKEGADRPAVNVKAMIAGVLVIFFLVGYPVPDYTKNRMLQFFRAYKISSAPCVQRSAKASGSLPLQTPTKFAVRHAVI